ncbi:MAG: hypothetical protein K5662_03190 [Lachnospiraceae bacterium]|nr:hypothetical protein [Lachnospiraceae bacterium]
MEANWRVLGIDPTVDKAVITKAYRAKLKNTNPEDDPEGFIKLRGAYEDALEYAKTGNEKKAKSNDLNNIDNPVLATWGEKLAVVYDDFAKRIDEKCWKELFADEVCESIESNEEAFEYLIEFLMDHFFLPHSIWVLIDDKYNIQGRYEDLCEKWPKEFFDRLVIPAIKWEEALPYRLFVPGKDGEIVEKYLGLYRKADDIRGREGLEAITEAESLSESHPYGKALKFSLSAQNNEEDYAGSIVGLEELVENYPDDDSIRNMYLGTLCAVKEYKKCEDKCREYLSKDRDNWVLNNTLATSLAEAGKLEEAFEILKSTMRKRNYSFEIMGALGVHRAQIADKILEDISIIKNNGDSDYYKKLAWYTMCSSKPDMKKVAAYAKHIVPEEVDAYDYHSIMTDVYAETKEYDKLVACNEELIERIEYEISNSDGDLEIKNSLLSSLYTTQMEAYRHLGDIKSSKDCIKKALDRFPDNELVRIAVVRTLIHIEDFEGAADAASKILEKDNLNYFGWYCLAEAAFGMWDDNTAFEAGTRMIQIFPNYISGYLFQLRVLIRNNAYDQASEVIDYLNEKDMGDDPNLRLYKTILYENDDKEKAYSEYIEIYNELARDKDITDKPYEKELLESKIEGHCRDKVRMLRREGKGEEAVRELKTICELIDIPLDRSPLLSIYMQFSMWDEAEAYLASRDESMKQETLYDEMVLNLCKGDIDKFIQFYKRFNMNYPNLLQYYSDIVCYHYLRLCGDLKGQKDYWYKRVKKSTDDEGDVFSVYSSLAFSLRRLGKRLGARKYAKLALTELENALKNDPNHEALYLAEMSRTYAVLGDFDKAQESLVKCRKCNLCSTCDYSECKDSYIFEMLIEMLKGNYSKAHEIARFGMKEWPDDPDFICHEYEMKRLGV